VEPVLGAFVLKQYAVIADPRHHVPEPPHRVDGCDLVARPVLDQRRRIPGPHELSRRVLDQPSRGNAGDLFFKGLLLLWRVGEQIDYRVEGHDGRDARLSRGNGPVSGDHRGDEREMAAGRTAA
jgi:hypothetical protein